MIAMDAGCCGSCDATCANHRHPSAQCDQCAIVRGEASHAVATRAARRGPLRKELGQLRAQNKLLREQLAESDEWVKTLEDRAEAHPRHLRNIEAKLKALRLPTTRIRGRCSTVSKIFSTGPFSPEVQAQARADIAADAADCSPGEVIALVLVPLPPRSELH